MVSSWILSLSPWLNGFPSHQIWSSTGNQLSAEDATPASLSLRLFVIIKAKQDVVTIMTIRMRNLRTMTIAQSVILGQQKVGKLGKKQGKGCERCSRSNVMITHSSSELLTCHAKGSRPPKKKLLHLNNTAWKINKCDNLGWFIHDLLNFVHNLPNWFLKLLALWTWWNWDIVVNLWSSPPVD